MTLGELCIVVALLVVISVLKKILTELHHVRSIMDTAQLVKLKELIDDVSGDKSV